MSSNEVFLGDIATIVDCEHKTAPVTQNETHAYSVGTKALSGNFINLEVCKPVDENTYKAWSKRAVISVGDIILAREAPVGGIGLVKKSHPLLCLGQRTVLIKPNREIIDPVFLSYFLQSSEIQTWFSDMSTGSTVLHLNVGDIKKLPLRNLPHLKTQKRIAEILQNLELAIENNRAIANSLEGMAEALFRSWFVDYEPVRSLMAGETLDGLNKQFANVFPKSMQDSVLGPIPSGWTVESIGSLGEVLLGGTPSRSKPEFWNGEIPWINSGKVKDFRILKPTEYISELGLQNSATKLLPAGTCVIGITGYIWYSRLEISACGNQSIIGILGSERASDEFIFLNIKNHIQRLINFQTGTAQQHINKEDVSSLQILYPGQEVVNIFTSKVRAIFEEIGVLLKQCMELEILRDVLLPRLIGGTLEIPKEMLAS